VGIPAADKESTPTEGAGSMYKSIAIVLAAIVVSLAAVACGSETTTTTTPTTTTSAPITFALADADDVGIESGGVMPIATCGPTTRWVGENHRLRQRGIHPQRPRTTDGLREWVGSLARNGEPGVQELSSPFWFASQFHNGGGL